VQIKGADWVVAYDGQQHRLLKNGDVWYEGNTIIHVGPSTGYVPEGKPADEVVDGSGFLVIPGLINTHGHATGEALKKGVLEDTGSRKLGMSGLYEYPIRPATREDMYTALRVGLLEMLKSGCTTVLEEGQHDDESVHVVAETGIRAYVTRIYNAGWWYTRNGHRVDYDLDDERGRKSFEEAVEFTRRHQNLYDGRIKSLLSPHAPDTCPPWMLRMTREAADELGVPVHVHCAQSVVEFDEMIRRYGRTPVEVLYDAGLVGPDVMFGHCVFLNDHPWINYRDANDLQLILETRTNVDYAPWVFGRRGIIMHSFARLVEAGVNVSLGTDSFPQDMMEVMRWAAIFSKIAERDPWKGTAGQVFTAATLGGAKALGRDDLGRLAPGAKADIVLVDLNNLWMRPVRDPIKSLVFTATSRAVHTVIVDGRVVVKEGRVLTLDEEKLVWELQAAADRAVAAAFPHRDWAGRTIDEIAPLSFPLWQAEEAEEERATGAAR